MKLAILILGICITGLITFSSKSKNISGTWVMQQDKIWCNLPVMRIKMGEGIWKGKIDLPELEEYDIDIYSIGLNGDSVFITLFKNGTTINATLLNDSTLIGEMSLDGSSDAVKFIKN